MPVYCEIFAVIAFAEFNDFELFGVVVLEVGEGDSHGSGVTVGYFVVSSYFDSFVIIVGRVFFGGVAFDEGEFFVAFCGVEIGEPVDTAHGEIAFAIFYFDAAFGCGVGVVIGDLEPFCAAVVVAEPEFVCFDERVDFLVGDGVLVAEDKKFFLVGDKSMNVVSEERKGWVADNDVSFLQCFDTFRGAEISIAL
nr:hypothetical protein [Rothia sp. ZJ932]